MMQNEIPLLQNKTIDRLNQEKLYIQLTRIFLEEINSGRWKLEQQIPTEEDLCKKYNVSKITVRQAINNLVSDGYLIKIQGKGTFVASALPVVGLAMKTRLTEEMFGKEVSVEREILFRVIREPQPEAKEYLKTEDEIYYILSRRVVSGEPVYIEESYIPYRMLPEIEKLDIARNSLYSILQEKGAKKIFKVIQTIEIAQVKEYLAKNLNMKEGAPVLVVHRLFLSSDGTPVAYTRLMGRGDGYKFQTEFERIR
ncbi:MAG: GntR family transcriptional regulator [Nitrospiraceae bacterium]|jgi:GntR family transcriptional regulator|nr:GntR family transcriptional regulator [Nitrospiraceae bacterium]